MTRESTAPTTTDAFIHKPETLQTHLQSLVSHQLEASFVIGHVVLCKTIQGSKRGFIWNSPFILGARPEALASYVPYVLVNILKKFSIYIWVGCQHRFIDEANFCYRMNNLNCIFNLVGIKQKILTFTCSF